jgi:hypothetical protein
MNNFFKELDMSVIEKFEIIFDRAQNETTAKKNALDYYFAMTEDDPNTEIEISEIINIAESYGFNFDDFEELIEQNLECC